MRYTPRLNNGKAAPLSWPVAIFRYVNHVCWPLEDGSSWRAIYLDRLLVAVGFVFFIMHNDGDLRYVRQHFDDIDLMLTGMPTYLIMNEMMIRIFHFGAHKEKFKKLFQKFYAEIYIEKNFEATLYRRIKLQVLPTQLNSIMYMLALFNFFTVIAMNIIYKRRDFLYKMIFPFDTTSLYVYVPLLLTNFYVGTVIDTMLFGEVNILGEMMMHLNARFKLLKRDLMAASELVLRAGDPMSISAQYRGVLLKVLRRNVALQEFAEELERQFTLRIFVMFSFSAAMLCVLSFKVYINPVAGMGYGAWFVGKALELLAFGMLGSILQQTTDDLSTMYYTSNWEQIVYHSQNTHENVQLMKLIALAITVNAKSFNLTGLSYFRVTLAAVMKILQGAFSYLTFLISLR